MTLTVGSLFSGIGGIDLACERAGMRVAWQCEIDRQCQFVLGHHFPGVPCHWDIREMDGKRLEPVDVVVFGSPCQDLSVAGQRAGLSGERSGLFHEAIRIIRDVRPTFALWENVPGALSSNHGLDFAAVLDSLADIGTLDIAWTVLDAQWFGVPQRRRRIFLVADFRGERAGEILFEPESLSGNHPPRRQAREDVAGTLGGGSGERGWAPDTDRMTFVAHTLRAEGHDASEDGTGRGTPLVAMDVYPTLSAHEGGTLTQIPPITHGAAVRRLTPLECSRLQGFPDSWLDIPGLSDSAKYRMLGNSVAVPCVEWITRRMAQHEEVAS